MSIEASLAIGWSPNFAAREGLCCRRGFWAKARARRGGPFRLRKIWSPAYFLRVRPRKNARATSQAALDRGAGLFRGFPFDIIPDMIAVARLQPMTRPLLADGIAAGGDGIIRPEPPRPARQAGDSRPRVGGAVRRAGATLTVHGRRITFPHRLAGGERIAAPARSLPGR